MNDNMTLEVLVKNNYKKIVEIVNDRAFSYFMNNTDLLSLVNLKLTQAINSKKYQFEHKSQFFGFLRAMVNNTALDLKRGNNISVFLKQEGKKRNVIKYSLSLVDISDIKDISLQKFSLQPDFQIKEFLNTVCIELSLSKRKGFKQVFESYFIAGMQYQQVCDELGLPMSTVKRTIFEIRKFINSTYGQTYKQLTT